MRLYEYEQSIKDMVDENPQNPKIYEYLQQMIYMFLRRKNVGGSERDIEEVSFSIAGDIWIKILSGERYNRYIGYLNKTYHDYFRDYYIDKKYSEPYDPSYDMKVIGGEIDNPQRFLEVIDKLYLEQIELIVDDFFESGCKYTYGSRAWVNLKLSLVLSMYRQELVNYHLTSDQFAYLKILIVRFHEKFRV